MSETMQKAKRVAVVDGPAAEATIGLYWERDGDIVQEIPWPPSWPSWVSVEFLREQGYEVVNA